MTPGGQRRQGHRREGGRKGGKEAKKLNKSDPSASRKDERYSVCCRGRGEKLEKSQVEEA